MKKIMAIIIMFCIAVTLVACDYGEINETTIQTANFSESETITMFSEKSTSKITVTPTSSKEGITGYLNRYEVKYDEIPKIFKKHSDKFKKMIQTVDQIKEVPIGETATVIINDAGEIIISDVYGNEYRSSNKEFNSSLKSFLKICGVRYVHKSYNDDGILGLDFHFVTDTAKYCGVLYTQTDPKELNFANPVVELEPNWLFYCDQRGE